MLGSGRVFTTFSKNKVIPLICQTSLFIRNHYMCQKCLTSTQPQKDGKIQPSGVFSYLIVQMNELTGNVSGYICNHGSLNRERDTASPRGRYGERLQRDSCLKHTI